ncbi:LPS-assembly protein [Luminiphilus syltensis NOR5-1B]|uniref:LPS-assembly protein LptD n=1 Tax=Luminiphilus syltensis NOR5-1B TaxID=565045 RepID=B8KVY6_9GAMM|nr:LPS-assembly protein LptD [Luminiphilus syltensis]EED36589.1 LPS-assembly protein [Luminiphilus syltensis NOR5-1B]
MSSLMVATSVIAACSLPTSADDAQDEPQLTESVVTALDWRPLDLIPESERNLQCLQCGGDFIDPLGAADRSQIPSQHALKASADNSEVTEDEVIFSGNVTVKQGYRRVKADNVRINRTLKTAVAEGNVVVREPGVVLTGEGVSYDGNTEVTHIENARFALHEQHISGAAGSLTRLASGMIEITEGQVTYCAPGDPTWVLTSRELALDPGSGTGTARGAKLSIAGVPVFYTPWIQFPLDRRRKTGLLFPDIGSDTRGGLDITAPVYLNLAPNYDATLAPRYIAERGLLQQVNGRWLSGDVGRWDVNLAYLDDDEKYRQEIDSSNGERWLVGVQQRGTFNQVWRTEIDFARVSDTSYFKDLDNQTLSAQRETALIQLGQVDYLGKDWTVNVQAQQFQTLADDIREGYKKLPQITAQYRGNAAWRGFEPIAEMQYSNFDRNDNRVLGHRLYAEAGIRYPMAWEFGFLRPTLKRRQVSYDLENTSAARDNRPNAGSTVASVDGGLFFERQTTIGGEPLTQTLEPRIYYLYSQKAEQRDQPDFDSAELTFSYNQLYRDTRFSGNDRLDDADQVSVGVTTRFFSDVDGLERMSASVGQIFYFRDREVRLSASSPPQTQSNSSLAAEFNWLPTETWKVRSSLLYDPYETSFEAANLQVSHTPSNGSVFNVGYTRREPLSPTRPINEQANFSGYYPIDENWSIFGALEYSLEGAVSVEDMFGVEYDDCCWRVRMLYMRYIDTTSRFPDFSDPDLEREHAFQFQIVLKGMGGFGGRVDNLLRDMIRGFNDRY